MEHHLFEGSARVRAMELQRELSSALRLDYTAPGAADVRFGTDYLFGPALGQMLGVLECENAAGQTVYLQAFSAQYNGCHEIPGWVPPVFDVGVYEQVTLAGDRRIKALNREMDALDPADARWQPLRMQRRLLSRELMKSLQELSILHNFRGEKKPLAEFFGATNGAPAGAGDCCAPKLLNFAARNRLRPRGIAEFYWGATNRSDTRHSGEFYASCTEKCQPILGFMLCGVGS